MTIAGINLKMYMGVAATREWLRNLAASETTLELFVLPSYVSLPDAKQVLGPAGIGYGAQDVSTAEGGPYTGEVSASALAELGCRYTAIGHAERRQRFGEDDAAIAAKARALADAGIVPLACIGEVEPDEGHRRPCAQMDAVLAAVADEREVIFAYEPVWAIGAAEPPPTEYIIDMAQRLQARYASRPGRTRLIYGGSAGRGLYTSLAGAVDGLFLGRFAHDTDSLRAILAEMEAQAPRNGALPHARPRSAAAGARAMKVGLSTYAYHWRRPSLSDMLDDVARLGGEVLQICDWPELEDTSRSERRALSEQAASIGIELEVGTRADSVNDVRQYLSYCEDLEAHLLRVLPAPALVAADAMGDLLPACEAAHVTLALETYESVPTQDLLALVTRLDHPRLGICLDPSNCVAALEPPDRVIAQLGPHTVNIHVKDFLFRRREDQIGFRLVGCPLGDGMLDLGALLRAAHDSPADCNAIIELWLPHSGERTNELEARWSEASLDRLRREVAPSDVHG